MSLYLSPSDSRLSPRRSTPTQRQCRVPESVPHGVAGIPPDLHGGVGLNGLDECVDGCFQGLLEGRAAHLARPQEVEQVPERPHRIRFDLQQDMKVDGLVGSSAAGSAL